MNDAIADRARMQLPPRLLDLTPVMESCESWYVSLHDFCKKYNISFCLKYLEKLRILLEKFYPI